MTFQLVACAEMLWQDKPIEWRAARLREMGYAGSVGMEAFAKGSAFRAAFTL